MSEPGLTDVSVLAPSAPPSLIHVLLRLLVLDEMDQLDSKAQDVLYTIFEWPFLPKSRLCLIGKTQFLSFLGPGID